MSILPKAIYRLNTITIKTPKSFFTEIEQSSNLYGTTKDPPNSQRNLENQEQAEDIMLPDLKLYYKAIVIKKSMILA